MLWRSLFTHACTHAELAKGACVVGTATHRLRVRAWQALAVLSAFVEPSEAGGVVGRLWELLKVCIGVSAQSWGGEVIASRIMNARASQLKACIAVLRHICMEGMPRREEWQG